jgi:hypothetical protein
MLSRSAAIGVSRRRFAAPIDPTAPGLPMMKDIAVAPRWCTPLHAPLHARANARLHARRAILECSFL